MSCCERDPAAAAAALREALGLWQGDPLADLAYEGFAQPEIRRLEEARRSAFEARVDADLALGRHAEIVPELEAALAAEPLRERLHAQLMLALYRSGRQSDALEAYRRAHRRLVEDVGVEPGPDLRALTPRSSPTTRRCGRARRRSCRRSSRAARRCLPGANRSWRCCGTGSPPPAPGAAGSL